MGDSNRRVMFAVAVVAGLAAASCAGLLKKKRGPEPDEGMTSDVHAKHVGKIVFAGEELAKGKEDPDAFKKSFELGEPIYARVYLARSLYNEAIATTGEGFDAFGFELRAFIDGEEVSKETSEMKKEWTTYKIVIVRDPADTEAWKESRWFANEVLPAITAAGTHKVKLELWPRRQGKVYGTKPLAVGSFKLEAGDDVAKQVEKVRALDKSAGQARTAAAKADDQKHLDAGERWVSFSIHCFQSNANFAWSHKGKSSSNITSQAQWIPIGAKVKLCANAADNRCQPYTVITDEEEQHIDYKCD